MIWATQPLNRCSIALPAAGLLVAADGARAARAHDHAPHAADVGQLVQRSQHLSVNMCGEGTGQVTA